MHMQYNVAAFLLLFVTIVATATLLWTASLADTAPPRDWYQFAGPFLFVYLLLAFFCVLLMAPYCGWYMNSQKRRDDKVKRALCDKTPGIIVAAIILGLLVAFFILLPMQLETIESDPDEPWTATLLVLAFALLITFFYVLFKAFDTSPSFLAVCCETEETADVDVVPICLGGQSNAKYVVWYHRVLVFSLLLAVIGTFVLIPIFNESGTWDASDLVPALVLYIISLTCILVSGLVIFIVRLKRPDVAEHHSERQTIMLGLATLLALVGIIFAIQLLSSHVSVHILFAPLYIGLAISCCCLCCIVAEGEMTTGILKQDALGNDDSLSTSIPPVSAQIHANWEELQ